jgi:hypothetical protein
MGLVMFLDGWNLGREMGLLGNELCWLIDFEMVWVVASAICLTKKQAKKGKGNMDCVSFNKSLEWDLRLLYQPHH